MGERGTSSRISEYPCLFSPDYILNFEFYLLLCVWYMCVCMCTPTFHTYIRGERIMRIILCLSFLLLHGLEDQTHIVGPGPPLLA